MPSVEGGERGKLERDTPGNRLCEQQATNSPVGDRNTLTDVNTWHECGRALVSVSECGCRSDATSASDGTVVD